MSRKDRGPFRGGKGKASRKVNDWYSESDQSKKADELFEGIDRQDAAAVQLALRHGANANCARCAGNDFDESTTTPLNEACKHGLDDIACILLDAGANARWRDSDGASAILSACEHGHLSIVELLINRDNGLMEIADSYRRTPLLVATFLDRTEVVRFLLNRGASAHQTYQDGGTPLGLACLNKNVDIVRLLLNAGAILEARDPKNKTALHHAAFSSSMEVLHELILERNANMFVADDDGLTPFDEACLLAWIRRPVVNPLLEMYGTKSTQDHGSLALHAILRAAKYTFAEIGGLHPPLNPLRIILPLGKLTPEHFRILLQHFGMDLIGTRDDSGKLPIHIACRNNAPVEVLNLLCELDATTLHMADDTGALPLHLSCCHGNVEYASVRFLVERGGVGTLNARNREGALPLHLLCGSTNPSLRTVQYIIQTFPGSVAARTNEGQYPFMIAACESSAASLSVVYEIVRANPSLVVPR